MHYEYEKQSPRSAHFRYRRASLPAALPLFDADASTTCSMRTPELGDVERIALPSFSAFLAAHHRAHDPRTLNADDVPALVNACVRILSLLGDEQWHPITEIRDVAQALSYDRRLRDLRKLSAEIAGRTYYVHIDARRIAGTARTYEYRAHLQAFPQTQTRKDNPHD